MLNLLNQAPKEKVNDVCKSITSQSTSIGYQGVKIRTQIVVGTNNCIKMESWNLSFIFYLMPNMHNAFSNPHRDFKDNMIQLLKNPSC